MCHRLVLPGRHGGQALADGGLRQLRRAILRLRCVRHVPVPPPAGGRASGDLRAQGDADGAASRLHGALLPARLPGVEAGPRGLLPGRPVAGRAQHAVCESGQSSDAAGEGAHAAVQGQRRADAARLLRLPGGALPLLVPDLQQVRVRVRWAGGAGGAVAVQPGRRPAVAPAALLDGAHVQAGAPPPHGTLARQGQEDTVKGNLLFWSP
uniref:uncharacterized protein LOC131103352 isoform X9 n=1 Tax=Doryrhamphus excisus TaxID=161450 RepID=UPI0025AE7508|nr:uncharacterized protein LOC131103352 isoform X9 [Doryrhamphus excisus]